MQRSVDVGLGPQKEPPAQIVTFRCPAPELVWLKSFLSAKIKMSETAAWAVKMGREYVEAIQDMNERIDQLAAAEEMTRPRMVAKLIALGLAAYEKERKGRR